MTEFIAKNSVDLGRGYFAKKGIQRWAIYHKKREDCVFEAYDLVQAKLIIRNRWIDRGKDHWKD